MKKNDNRKHPQKKPVKKPVTSVPASKPKESGFDACIANAIRKLVPEYEFSSRDLEALATMDYTNECAVKQLAMKLFIEKHQLSGDLAALIPSPLPRGYRTTSKRRAAVNNGKFELRIENRLKSRLEPDMHNEIFCMLEEIMSPSHYLGLTRQLNYCILRGSYDKCCLIVNVAHVDGNVVRKIKQLAEELKKRESRIISCFMYLDETRSDYYLESRRPEGVVSFKKLFGPDFLELRIDDMKLRYPPTVFSQVNESIIPQFTTAIASLLKLKADQPLLDLYCGYGLLGLALAPLAESVTGMDIEGPSIKAAAANAAHIYKGKKVNYTAAAITADSLRKKLLPPRRNEVILLDPPRQGTAPGVIEELAARSPVRILHIFCGTDEIPRELELWQKSGYVPVTIAPLDMFPGSANLETMVLLEPGKRQ